MFELFKRKEVNPDKFWQEYEEKIQEKVLTRSLGQYISGWEEFDKAGSTGIWGLIIATSGGFRFHHFPHMGWLEALTRFSSGSEPPKEKTIFIPRERIISAELRKEARWWKRILNPSSPRLIIRYANNAGEDREMALETEYKTEGLAESLENRQS